MRLIPYAECPLQVRFVQVDSVKRQLDAGSVVLLSNLGFSAAGEVLNCDIYTVATRAAIDLGADKLICMTLPETQPIALPLWTPLSDAERVLSALVADREPTVGPSSIPSAIPELVCRPSFFEGERRGGSLCAWTFSTVNACG